MPCCSAVGCSNRSERGFRLFKFPANPCRRQVWITNCRRNNWTPTKSSFLCEVHFEADQYEQNRADGRKLLKPFAVPTIFNHEFKPQKLKEQIDYRPTAITNTTILPNAAVDHTYTIQNKNPPIEKCGFNNIVKNEQEIPQTTIVEFSFEPLDIDDRCMAMDVSNNNEGNDSLEKILQLWVDQSHFDTQPLEDNETHQQNGKLDISSSEYIPAPKKCLKKSPKSTKLETKIKKLELQLQLLKRMQKRKKTSTERHKEKTNLNHLYHVAESGNVAAEFIVDQALNLLTDGNTSKWSVSSIKNCLSLKIISPIGYNYIHQNCILRLPSRHFLKRCVGFSTSDKALSTVMKHKLKQSTLNCVNGKWWSMVMEEMNFSQCSRKSLDFFFGQIDDNSKDNVKLLCIYVKEVILNFSLLVGFFPITNLDEIKISKFIINLLRDVESCGMSIAQVVVPRSMKYVFTHLGGTNDISGKINHPVDPNKFLFFNYDPNQLIQCVYREFLLNDFIVPDGCITSRCLTALHQQSDSCIKVPDIVSLEKVNSTNPSLLFSTEHCKFLKRINNIDFTNVGPTVEFIETMSRWFALQNKVCSEDLQKSANWLRNDVCEYINKIEYSCRESNMPFLNTSLLTAFKFSTFTIALFYEQIKNSK